MKNKQLTLGELIEKLESVNKYYEMNGKQEEKEIRFEFADVYPTGVSSWRGVYSHLAIEWDGGEYGDNNKAMSANAFLQILKDSVGKTFEGWKGGDYIMGNDTPLWVSNRGLSSYTAPLDIKSEECEILIVTGTCEY